MLINIPVFLQCYSAEELYRIYSLPQDLALTSDQFSVVCPSLVQQILSRECVASQTREDDDATDAESEFLQRYSHRAFIK